MVESLPGSLPPQTHTLSVKERAERGRALRERLARKHHGGWKAPADRRDPIEILIEQGEARLPDLLPLRYGRMRPPPFTFLPGPAPPMPPPLPTPPTTALLVHAPAH